MENKQKLCADAVIGSDTFMRFSLFDTFVLKKRWRSPALFALIMSAFATVCFLLSRTKEQAALLGTVLLSIGLVLPTVYVLMYIFSVRATAKKLSLGSGKKMYSFEFTSDSMRVSNGKETADFRLDALPLVYFDKKCTYIYTDKTRAFLLPEGSGSSEITSLLSDRVPADRLMYNRKRIVAH